MKIALLSDIHANIHALEAVWQDIQFQKSDRVYCLGDLVGYGAHPNEVVEFIRHHEIPTVMGNFDEAVGFGFSDCGCSCLDDEFGRLGDHSLTWTKTRTTQENKAFLRSLPMHIREEGKRPKLLMVHGSPRRIDECLNPESPRATFEHIARVSGVDIIFFGHTHSVYRKMVSRTLFINTGSVGVPVYGDPRASYILVELGWRVNVKYRRVEYDIQAAAHAVREAGLPDLLSYAFELGGNYVTARNQFSDR